MLCSWNDVLKRGPCGCKWYGIMFCQTCGHEICQYIDNSAE